ncbi:MAG: GRP family sugar transporter [Holophagaceae bacterium]|nr:GRP family sugar transporter [Holophagaceae bacterium]
MILGFIFSIVISILFALYAVPRKFSSQNVILYTMWMGVAYCTITIIAISVLWGFGLEPLENLFNPWHFLTVLRAFVWVLGMFAYNVAIDKIGLTRFNQWKNIQGPVGSLLILFFVSENVAGIKIFWLFLGITVMFLSALLFQVRSPAETMSPKKIDVSANTRWGIAFAIFSGICFGISAMLNSVVSNTTIVGEKFTFSQLIYHSVSLTIFSVAIYLIVGNRESKPTSIKERLKDCFIVDKKTWLPIIAGGMYMIATLLTIYSYRLIPNNAIPWSITQLNVFWTLIIGLFIFKEIDFKQNWQRLVCGTLLAILSCIALFFAI